MYLISGLLFHKDRGLLKTVSKAFDGALWGKKLKKFALPQKNKYLQNIKKKTNLFIIKGKNFCRTLTQNMIEDRNYKNFYISCNLKK